MPPSDEEIDALFTAWRDNFPWKGITLRPQALREDRILHEIHATGGDARRICDLFGLSVEGAARYLKTVEHADLTIGGERVLTHRHSSVRAD